ASTSSTWARRAPSSPPSARRAMLVIRLGPVPVFSAEMTWFQSSRTMSSTDSTVKACVVRAYSVTSIRLGAADSLQPMIAGRSYTGITCSRRCTTPSENFGAPAIGVMVGRVTISRTFSTLMPKSSDWPRTASVPRRNSSSSNRLVPVRLVRSSISFWSELMSGLVWMRYLRTGDSKGGEEGSQHFHARAPMQRGGRSGRQHAFQRRLLEIIHQNVDAQLPATGAGKRQRTHVDAPAPILLAARRPAQRFDAGLRI